MGDFKDGRDWHQRYGLGEEYWVVSCFLARATGPRLAGDRAGELGYSSTAACELAFKSHDVHSGTFSNHLEAGITGACCMHASSSWSNSVCVPTRRTHAATVGKCRESFQTLPALVKFFFFASKHPSVGQHATETLVQTLLLRNDIIANPSLICLFKHQSMPQTPNRSNMFKPFDQNRCSSAVSFRGARFA